MFVFIYTVSMKYIIDVRTKGEFDAGHYDDALHHELSKIESGDIPTLDRDSSIEVYCRRGIRAEKAKRILEAEGFSNITNIGGYKAV